MQDTCHIRDWISYVLYMTKSYKIYFVDGAASRRGIHPSRRAIGICPARISPAGTPAPSGAGDLVLRPAVRILERPPLARPAPNICVRPRIASRTARESPPGFLQEIALPRSGKERSPGWLPMHTPDLTTQRNRGVSPVYHQSGDTRSPAQIDCMPLLHARAFRRQLYLVARARRCTTCTGRPGHPASRLLRPTAPGI
jgi:hypothetical protein